ncbi:polysaccharide biosynthesis protein [Paenibacillus terrae]|uniref:UDP-N-acetylglucosamine 4,6-dehydratase n=1 Tax=Paenibacillus terrae TaxID=159743 RepID=A0A0D7WWL9_9BACL|nr:polysaccharide biosynthesis protein [Paenibacillus terrae]KJD43364.1 UDP-N-acetylglucosamine 4,6-dehydratase [Paenibacillus terrae]
MFEGKKLLVTGGTGSWGQRLTEELLKEGPAEIRVFSRGEFAQIAMQRQFQFDPRLNFVIGDIRDLQALQEACRGMDYVFHLAALKHVPVCERQPEEAFKTNVHGTQNVIRASIEQGVTKVIDVSTDKAVDPVNVYGMTKAIGERLMIRANDLSERTRFVCIRGGNVLGTSGSVVPLFKRQIAEGQDLTLTSPDMTRFFLTLGEAIGLLLKASVTAIGGETLVMKMKGCNIADLAEVMKEQAGQPALKVKEIGIRGGEKLHEVLISPYEVPHTYRYDDRYFVILPQQANKRLLSQYGGLERVSFDQYRSDDELMDRAGIAELLRGMEQR